MDQIQPYLNYFADHPNWALAIIFLISFGEALLVIGLFVPSTAVLVGAGTLVGAGKLHFWPVLVVTILGCILGDQVSYWAGRIYGERLRSFWPMNRYPHLVAKGEEFFKSNGGKSIALGRFVPGVKAVVPGIAGMFGMSEGLFLTVNVSSGIVWAAAHVLPGVLLGKALNLAGELSGRLLVVLLVLLAILAFAGWFLRILAGSISPYRKALQGRISNWASTSNNKFVRRLAHAIAPENPRSVLLVLLLICTVLAVVALIDIVSGLVLRHAVGDLDLTLNNLFSESRSVPGDELMERITMMGDELVLWATAAAIIGWLLLQKSYRAAWAAGAALVLARLILLFTSFTVGAPPSNINMAAFHFPSDHALLAGTVFGLLAMLCSHTMARWTQAVVVSALGIIVIAISFTRLYLGANWMSDVAGGLLIALIISTLYGVTLATIRNLRIRPFGLLGVTMLAFVLAGAAHISVNYDSNELAYAPQNKLSTYPLADWVALDNSKVPARRIDIAGKTKEVFVIQWLGSPDSLKSSLEALKYKPIDKWTWHDSINYLNPGSKLVDLAPRPATHEGLKAKLTAIFQPDAEANSRLTLRAFQSNAVVKGQSEERVYLISLTHEVLHSQFNMIAIPMGAQVSVAEARGLIDGLKALPNIESMGEKLSGGLPVAILRPKS